MNSRADGIVAGEDPATEGLPAGGLRVEGLRVVRDGVELLEGVAFRAPAGRLTALVGPNGAGKSTLLRAISGVEQPAAGTIRFAGEELLRLSRRERARRIALLEQDASTELPLTVRSVAQLGRTPHESWLGGDDPRSSGIVDEALERTGAAAHAERTLPSLSGGERQRAFLARALAQEPRLLVLDEPTNHLDVGAALDVLGLVEGLTADGVTVIAALHELSLAAAYADHVVVLHDGHVVAEGAPRATLTPDLLSQLYGVRASWLENPITGRPLLAVGPHWSR